MKCPNCSYFNLPGALTCGQCRRSLDGESKKEQPEVVPIHEIMPPRAKNRSAAMQIEARSPTARQARRFAEKDWDRTRSDVRNYQLGARLSWQSFKQSVLWWTNLENLRQAARWNTAPLLSIVPGAGQILQRRYLMAGVLVLLLIPLLSGVFWIMSQDWNIRIIGWLAPAAPLIALPYALALNGVMAAFCVLVWFSVWDAASHSYPLGEQKDLLLQRLRSLRLAFGSAIYAGVMLAAFFRILDLLLT